MVLLAVLNLDKPSTGFTRLLKKQSQLASSLEFTGLPQFHHCAWINWIFVRIYDSRLLALLDSKRPPEKSLRGGQISFVRQQEVDGFYIQINCSKQVHPLAFDFDAGPITLGGRRTNLSSVSKINNNHARWVLLWP